MRIRKYLLMYGGLLLGLSLTAQTETLRVWPDGVPGAIPDENYLEKTDTLEGNRILVTRVSDPTLSVYPAPGDLATGTAVIVCPGGAYFLLAIGHEGRDVARWLNRQGITAFVLKYRLPSDAIMEDKSVGPLQDAQEALRIVRRRAGNWGIDPGRIGIMGFSAGGHLASTLSTHYDARVYPGKDTTSARPDFSLLIYPVISMDQAITHAGSRLNLLGASPGGDLVDHFSNEKMVNGNTPPAFLVHSADDGTVNVENSIRYMQALKENGVPVEMHIYQEGGHGYGLGRKEGTKSGWPEACLAWLRANGF